MTARRTSSERASRLVLAVGLAGVVLLSTGCYRKVIRAEGIGARTSNPRLQESSIPKNDPVGDFLFGPRAEPGRVQR